MPTEFLREKINTAAQMIQQAVLEQFQLELAVAVAAESTGDAQVDANMQAMATNARAQLLAVNRRLAVYRSKLDALNAELAEIKAQCEGDRALCLACEDGMVVVELRPHQDSLELFVWIAIAFRHGAFDRQHAALHSIGCDLGARTIAFQSRRKGWARRLGPEWSPRGENEFVRQVDEQGR